MRTIADIALIKKQGFIITHTNRHGRYYYAGGPKRVWTCKPDGAVLLAEGESRILAQEFRTEGFTNVEVWPSERLEVAA